MLATGVSFCPDQIIYADDLRFDPRLACLSVMFNIDFVITMPYSDNTMIRTQISVDEDLYERAKEVAKRQGISLAELCRRGLASIVGREPSSRPWMAYAGILEGAEDDSSSVDAVVYDREAP
jgi:hypothetical protein